MGCQGKNGWSGMKWCWKSGSVLRRTRRYISRSNAGASGSTLNGWCKEQWRSWVQGNMWGEFAGARLKVFLELYIAGILCLECKVLGLGSSSDTEINSAFQMGKMTVEIKVREWSSFWSGVLIKCRYKGDQVSSYGKVWILIGGRSFSQGNGDKVQRSRFFGNKQGSGVG
jgi:hypothetical protein